MLREDFSVWQCAEHELALSRPRIMGILNVTPDSFSDGGTNLDPEIAVERGMQMLDEGADLIDVGGESTRPGFEPVTPDEEARRIVPVVRELVAAGAIVSVDTRHAEVAKMCARLGASVINDVSGFTDPAMVEVAATTNVGCVVMHAGEPVEGSGRRSVQLDSVPGITATSGAGSHRYTLPDEGPIMRGVMGFLGDRARELMRAGVAHDRICIDPGAGFGKHADEDVVIQRATRKLASMGYPLMAAISRKRVVGAVSGVALGQSDHTAIASRDAATLGMCLAAVQNGARILRVHDVAGVAQGLSAYWAVANPCQRRAFVALGSNVGDRIAYLERACQLLDALPLTAIVGVSHAYESEPAYGIATPVANCVAEIRTELAPLVLIDYLMDIEAQLGRHRDPETLGHGPRTIDCDLAFMENEIHAGRRLTLPHPGLGERDFVLVPMEDLRDDPARYLAHAGVRVLPREQRVGHVTSDLGEISWTS